jgi:hypothetical protein
MHGGLDGAIQKNVQEIDRIKKQDFFQKAKYGLALSSIKPKRKGDEYGSIDQV